MTNFKQFHLRNFLSKIVFFSFLFFVFSVNFAQIANATVYSPGATLEPDCAPGSPSCGVSTPAITNISNTNLTLTADRTLTLNGYTLTFEGTSFDVGIDANGNLSVGGGTISTPSSGLSLTANAGASGTIQIGTGGAGSATPDLLVTDVKSDAGDPAGTNGAVYYNGNTNRLRCYENGAWDNCVFRGTDSGQNLTLARIGNSTFSTLQDLQNVFHSAGYTSGGNITDAGGETVNVAAGTGLLRSSNSAVSTISYMDWGAVSGIPVPTNSVRYIGIEYNGGSPQISVRTSSNWNLKTDFSLGVVVNEGGVLSIFSDKQAVGDHAANMVQRDYETMPIEPDVRNGGLAFGETGTRNITLSAGAVWDRLNRYTVPALNTSISGDFDAYHMDGSGGFNKVTGLTQWPNTQYDDMSGNLATMTNGYYAVLWFYLDTNAKISMVYGMDEYTTLGLADAEMEPSVDMLPDRLKVFGKLLGKIIFQKGASSASQVVPLITMSSASSGGITSHASLTDLDYASSGHIGFANAISGVNDNITSATGLTSLTPSSGLTITAGGASVWSTGTGALTLDSASALNLGTTNATSLSLGKTGVNTTNEGNLILDGNWVTTKGTDYTTTGTQNNVDLGVGYTFDYHGAGTATFTGLAGGVDGRQLVVHNHSSSNLTLTNQDTNSIDANRIITTTGGSIVIPPDVTVSLEYDGGVSK
ncbi:hypothetical protein IT399_01205 [Candidatus Nomurabacteria bacterium]|nr:hypothetical protein [Candidatus Nomurabacteria bacterium]